MNTAIYNRLVTIKENSLMSAESFLKVCTVYFTFGMIDETQYNELTL